MKKPPFKEVLDWRVTVFSNGIMVNTCLQDHLHKRRRADLTIEQIEDLLNDLFDEIMQKEKSRRRQK